MIPKKPKLLYKQLAEDSDLNDSLVENLITFYYKELRKQMSALNHPVINVEGLGKFYVKSRTVDSLLIKYERQLAKTDGYSMSSYHNKIRLEQRIKELENIKEVLQERKENKESFFNKKNDK